MISLKPIRETTEEYDKIEKKIKDLFKKEIYLPLLKEFSEPANRLKNSIDDLLEAIRSGRITFSRGKFSGKLNATLSKELRILGAKWDSSRKFYSINQKDLPLDMRQVISSSEFRYIEKMTAIDRKLAAVVPEELASKLKIADIFDRTLFKVNKEFHESVKKVTIAPQLTDRTKKQIADEWQNNMHLWIKNFTEEQIKKLREDMNKSVFAGNRYESAIKSIQKSYGVTENKAKFLARQETSLLMTTFKESRYQEAGIHQYKWKCVTGTKQHPVRPMHKELNDRSNKGEIFRFDSPPVDDPNGARHNPGMNYNCRCVAIPQIDFKKIFIEK
jgi:SPP1 gp7 family putative phage head morphogenesis protein